MHRGHRPAAQHQVDSWARRPPGKVWRQHTARSAPAHRQVSAGTLPAGSPPDRPKSSGMSSSLTASISTSCPCPCHCAGQPERPPRAARSVTEAAADPGAAAARGPANRTRPPPLPPPPEACMAAQGGAVQIGARPHVFAHLLRRCQWGSSCQGIGCRHQTHKRLAEAAERAASHLGLLRARRRRQSPVGGSALAAAAPLPQPQPGLAGICAHRQHAGVDERAAESKVGKNASFCDQS